MSDHLVLQNETTANVINRVNADYWKDKNILITGLSISEEQDILWEISRI